MDLTKLEEITLDTYERYASQWATVYSNKLWSKELEMYRQLLPTGKILEIGSGGGRDARELLDLGYDYTGTDVSPAFLAEASKQNPDGRFILSSVYDLNFAESSFDGFWASAILLHLPKDRINFALQRIKRCIKKNAIGFISIKEGEGSELLRDEVGGNACERLFTYYLEPEFLEILISEGYSIADFHRKKGGQKDWLVYLVRC